MRQLAFRAVVFLAVAPFLAPAQTVEEGLSFYNKREWEEAKRVFEEVLKKDEKNAEAHYRLGMILLIPRFRNVDEAVEHTEEAVELNPSNADYQYGLGAAYGTEARDAGIFRQAILAPKVKKAFERAVQLNPKHIEARVGLAQYYKQAPGIMGGDEEQAWKELDALVQIDEIRGRVTRAGFFERDKKPAEAENEYKVLTTSYPKDWRPWKNLGYFYLRNKRHEEAVSTMQKYVTLRPDTADAHESYGECLLRKGDVDAAMTSLKKALSLDKNYAPAIFLLAEVYEAKGQKKEAKETYQWLLAVDTNENRRKTAEEKLKGLQ